MNKPYQLGSQRVNRLTYSTPEAQTNEDYKTRSNILQTLHTLPYKDRKNRNPDRVSGTCGWLVGHKDYKIWRDSKRSCMLWVSANPGCGKSVLAKYLVDSELSTSESRTNCYFFFKDDFEDQRSARSALSSILHQLFTQRQDLFSNNIIDRFTSYKTPLANSYYALWELWDILVMASLYDNAGEIICVIDALDECNDFEYKDLANALCKFYGSENESRNNTKLKFLVTSRPYDNIIHGLQPLDIPELPVVHLRGESDEETSKIAREIDVYIEHKVSRIRVNLRLSEKEEQLLFEELRAISNRTYLWVYLTLEWIETELHNKIDEEGIRRVTCRLPRTVDEAYEKILAKTKNPQDTKKLLHIIVAAVRPLTVAEMDLALALQQHHGSYKSRPDDRVYSYIRGLCGLFVNIIGSKIYLLHQTAKEFLVPKHDSLSHSDSQGASYRHIWKSSLQPQESHRILCQICIWYLLFPEFETNPLDVGPYRWNINQDKEVSAYLRNHVFLEYSATNWASHFRASKIEDDDFMKLLQRICDADLPSCHVWFRIYWISTNTTFPKNFTTLMILSYFGIECLVKRRLELADGEIDSKDKTYQRSALSWASENGFDRIVNLLIKGPKITLRKAVTRPWLRTGAKIDAKDRSGLTPLSYAAGNGHGSVVKALLKAGARADLRDEIGGTPIFYALCTGQQGIASQLMKGVKVDSVDEIRRTLFLSATMKGHEDVAKLLIENGADIEWKDGEYERTALIWAARHGHKTAVRLLLEKGANVEAKEKCGRTALLWAAACGQGGIVSLLLDKGADIEVKDEQDQTPLLLAARYRSTSVVKLLIEEGANIEVKDKHGQTPLLLAARDRSITMVKLFLEEGADFEAEDSNKNTPLLWAAEYGQVAMVKMLLKEGANADMKNKDGQSPLSRANENGHLDVVTLLYKVVLASGR